ncbi:pentatricopeptide repeat protein [Histoplasma capsulatum G186AR]|uniref:Pentatricopeptide repeat protein n=2 Tax=Ajellomyces capsulatus TaxID=5037 RepID=C0NDB3_AJECG|nr:pentatricopeptide repeat protein [Histoplasma capsulatum G186AR]EEH11654.1 pentatricopeptide repeat protein [Histoplasma capsulatum G186AR]KAG5302496.1 pentatricopeptide repeat protein [Histoplasma capsulatum]QSS72104.1 pentatricopeptide repeat protein [Histoplasma capsulatum G186AR]
MPAKTIVADGLWHCLCPSYKQASLKWRNFPGQLKRHVNPAVNAARFFSRTREAALLTPGLKPNVATEDDALPGKHDSDMPGDMDQYFIESPPGKHFSKRTLWEYKNLDWSTRNREDGHIERMLRKTVEGAPDYKYTMKLMRELIRRRGFQPQTWHYTVLITANSDALLGCPKHVRSLLKEMDENHIPIDSATLHAALQVLAVHPDYILRQTIIHTLRDRWLTISPEGWHNIVTGFIREGQFEMALDHISRMQAQNIQVEPWLYSLLIYNLCEVSDFDMILELMAKWISAGNELSPNLWFHILVAASESFHEKCVTFVWKKRVQLGLINPPYGVCSNILVMTSRTGNTWLAREVFRVLQERQGNFLLEDYNCFVDTCLAADDLELALSVLCTAQKATFKLDETATRSILTYCIEKNIRPRTVWQRLADMKTKELYNVPLVAVNAVIEMAIHHKSMTVALEFYHALVDVFEHRPSATTFNHLIRGCRVTGAHEMANFFVQEMVLLDIFPDRMTYELLVLLCVDAGRFREAHRYFVEMMDSGFSLTPGSKVHVRTRCFDSDDQYAKLLRYDSEIRKPIARQLMER